ncbi:MAG: helix-turn-helix transcriptional regulator [Elusimicrobiales bacterium]
MRCKVRVKAEAVRQKLAERNKTVKWLVYRLDITSGYFSHIIHGKRNPSPKLRQRMMRVLETENFDDLFAITK